MEKFEAKNIKRGDNKGQILGVKISGSPREEVLAKIDRFLAIRHKFTVFTPNPEILLLAEKDKSYREILNRADFALPDGTGLAWAAGVKRIPGREFFLDLLKLLDKAEGKVYLLGGLDASATRKAVRNLSARFRNLTIKGEAGPVFDRKGFPSTKEGEEEESRILREINAFCPDLVFVGLGAPKQEEWVDRNFDRLKCGGVMAVGRTFEYFSGKHPLPPKLMDRLGLEWLWRLITGSTDPGRIFRAVIVFPWRVLHERINRHCI